MSAGRHRSSVRESLHITLSTPVAALSSMAPKLPPSATCSLRLRRGFLVCGNLSPSQLPPNGAGPVPILLPLLFLFSFTLSRYVGVSCLLGGLTSSVSVQWVFYRSSCTCRCISDVSGGRKVISTSYSSAIFSSLLLFFCLFVCFGCVGSSLLCTGFL